MILFTGLTGKSGRWLLRSLENDLDITESQSFRALVRKESSLEILNRSSLNIEKVIGDTSDEEVLRLAMDGVDVVFHIAGIHTSRSVAKVALEKKVKWLILVHTTGIYSKYKSAGEEYRNTEKIIADLAKDSNTQITILRPTMIYGSVSDNNMVVFIKMVDRLRLFPVVSGGNFELQPVYEKDLGEAYFKVLQNREKTMGKNYILSGKEPIELIDVFRTIERKLKKKNFYFSVPFPIAYFSALTLWAISLGKVDYRERVQRLVEPRIFSHDEASLDFGYAPLSFEEGVENEIKEYLELKNRNNSWK